MLIEEQMQLVELKLQPAVRDRRFSYPDSGRPLARRDSHKGLRSSPSCHMTNGRLCALIYKHGNRRVRARIRNMLDHFLHDEGIPNDEANYLRSFTARFFAQNRAVIQLHKQHQSCFAQAFLDCAFQFGENALLTEGAPVAQNGWSDRRSPQLLM